MKDLALACNQQLKICSLRLVVQPCDILLQTTGFTKGQIKESLAVSISPIHISSNLWTSPHRHSLLAVCAQWVNPKGQLQKARLGLPECRYSHSGEKQASLILQVVEEFGIQSKLGWHTGDNATSNDTCLETIESRLLAEHQVQFNAKQRRIRCIGHIINLSLQASLLASSKEALLAALTAAADVSGEELLAQFPHALTSKQRKNQPERRQLIESQESQSGQRHARRRGSRVARFLQLKSPLVFRRCLLCANSMIWLSGCVAHLYMQIFGMITSAFDSGLIIGRGGHLGI
jgi:hypothetical protein